MSDQPVASTPTIVSFLVCDQVIDDKLTGKKSAIGIFNTIFVREVPSAVQHMAILASLTEIVGRVQMELRLVRDADNSVVFSGRGEVEAPSPLAVVDLLFSLQGVRVPAEGQYAFELLASNELLGRRRFQVRIRQQPGPAGNEETPEGA